MSTSVRTGRLNLSAISMQAHGLAVAFGLGHAEVVPDATLGIRALLMADHDHRAPAEAAEPAHDGLVLGEIAVAGQRREVLDQGLHIVETMRPLWVAGDLCLLPGRELSIGIEERRPRLLLELLNLFGNRHAPSPSRAFSSRDLAFELGYRLLEVEIGANGDVARSPVFVGSKSGLS